MLFWIPMAIIVILLIVGIFLSAAEGESTSFGAMFVVAIFVALIGVIIGAAVIPGNLYASNASVRVTRSADLVPINSQGDYVSVVYTKNGEIATYKKLVDGVAVPYTVWITSTDVDRTTVDIVPITGHEKPTIQDQQAYINNPAEWPWLFEGDTTTVLNVPKADIVVSK